MLNNSLDLFYYESDIPIQIIGLESHLKNKDNIKEAFKDYNDDLYTIVLMHEPDNYLNISNRVDLVLAGHSHNGQIRIPFIGAIYTPAGAKTYFDKEYIIKDSHMFISSGLGTTKINFRLFNPPSFNIYRLYKK